MYLEKSIEKNIKEILVMQSPFIALIDSMIELLVVFSSFVVISPNPNDLFAIPIYPVCQDTLRVVIVAVLFDRFLCE